MKLKIIGSGGCVSTPRPCCNCPICVEARKKGFPMREPAAVCILRIKEVIITHLEEDWGKTYDNYRELEKQYKNVKFAYDGLERCF